jgi:hypothetical protein
MPKFLRNQVSSLQSLIDEMTAIPRNIDGRWPDIIKMMRKAYEDTKPATAISGDVSLYDIIDPYYDWVPDSRNNGVQWINE